MFTSPALLLGIGVRRFVHFGLDLSADEFFERLGSRFPEHFLDPVFGVQYIAGSAVRYASNRSARSTEKRVLPDIGGIDVSLCDADAVLRGGAGGTLRPILGGVVEDHLLPGLGTAETLQCLGESA